MAKIGRWILRPIEILSMIGEKVIKLVEAAYLPWNASSKTAVSILSAPSMDQKTLIDRFIIMKQTELNIVAVTSALVGSLVTSLMSWSWFPIPSYTTRICMLCALLHSLIAIATATQQLVTLSRISVHKEYQTLVLSLLLGQQLSITNGTAHIVAASKPSRLQQFSWQIPTMLLGNSVVFVIVGLAIDIFGAAVRARGVWSSDCVTAVCFGISLVFSVSSYLVSWSHMEWSVQRAVDSM